LTSLAPSPIDKVTFLGYFFFTKLTISAFYFGETLHARTTSGYVEASTKFYLKSSLASISNRLLPAVTIAYLLL